MAYSKMHFLFQNKEQLLCKIFSTRPIRLNEHQAHDLSIIIIDGKDHMTKYCEDYVLGKESLKIQNYTFTPWSCSHN